MNSYINFDRGFSKRNLENCCCGKLTLTAGVKYGSIATIVVSLASAVINFVRAARHPTQPEMVFVFVFGGVMNLVALVLSGNTARVINQGRTWGLTFMINCLVVLAFLSTLLLSLNVFVGFELCETFTQKYETTIAMSEFGGVGLVRADFKLEDDCEFEGTIQFNEAHVPNPNPVDGIQNNVLVQGTNISFQLGNLHDGPHSWYIYTDAACTTFHKPPHAPKMYDLSGRHANIWYYETPGYVARPGAGQPAVLDHTVRVSQNDHIDSIYGKYIGITKTVLDAKTGAGCVNEECPVMRCARLEAKVKTFKEERMVAKTSILCNAEYDVAYFLLDVGTAAWFIYFAWVTTSFRNSQSTAPAGNEMAPVGSSVGHGM